ncbi:argonaute [Kwoniella mangroviensis CBS 10435]|uniref:Argonaute n=1 Tax=Kwoniella mangroviensis CBS 10435 TaxID=1331196 RepID=A0A1B9ITF2_9TREE|nr:argonaute [Kwoniella mangroviensis CBS 10435]
MATPKSKSTGNPGDLISGMENLAIGTTRGMQETLDGCPPRPGYGTAGKAIDVRANMYLTRFKNEGALVDHYDIEINPVVKVTGQKKPRALLQQVWDQMVKEAKGELKKALDAAAYDQVKSFYTPYPVPMQGDRCEVMIALKEDGKDPKSDTRRFKAVIQFAQKVDLQTIVDYGYGNKQTEQARATMLVAIQAMNVLFRQDPAKKYTMSGAAGRRFFSEEGGYPLSNGGVLYRGFQQSFRWTSAQFPALQIDTAYSAFIEPGMLPDVGAKLLGMGGGGGGGRGGRGGRGFDRGGRGGRGGLPQQGGHVPSIQDLNPGQIRKLNEYLKMAKFKVTHRATDRIFTMTKISSQPAEALKFNLTGKDGKPDRQVSVPQYYKEVYNRQVTKPRLPCVLYGKNNYIPLEFVKLEPFNKIPMVRLTADQTAEIIPGLTTLNIIRHAAKPPPEREATINSWRLKLDYSNLPKIKAWGVEVNKNMMTVPARVLNPPNVLYGQGKSLRANFGGWNLKAVQFSKPGKPLKSWSVVSFDDRCTVQDMRECTYTLDGCCKVENRQPDCFTWDPHGNAYLGGIKAGLQEAARKAYMKSKMNPQLIVVVMPKKDVPMYKAIKANAAEGLLKPVVTQCLQSAKIKSDRGMDQYCGNVAMKVHAKLGGITHVVGHGIEKNTMMVGADVTHPPLRDGLLSPSIAVSISAINGENNKFTPAIRQQEGRVEIIQDLENMMYDHIVTFEKNTKTKPEKILFFRDGVSEGQYAHCVQYEVEAIKKAARRFGKYMPKITFVICAKRHAMRFFAAKDEDRDRTGNLPPGTIVDKQVTSPMVHDFYLQAHAGLQGTARPTHYVVVADENKYTADKLQKLVNDLCYTFARATRSVSLVPVAYYADIVAEKVRDWVYNEDTSTEAASTAPSSGAGGKRETMTFDPLRIKKRIEADAEFNNVGWYM